MNRIQREDLARIPFDIDLAFNKEHQGEVQKKLRTSSLAQLQADTGIDRAMWSKYFNGKVEPTVLTIEAIARKYNVYPSVIIDVFMLRRDEHTEKMKAESGTAQYDEELMACLDKDLAGLLS